MPSVRRWRTEIGSWGRGCGAGGRSSWNSTVVSPTVTLPRARSDSGIGRAGLAGAARVDAGHAVPSAMRAVMPPARRRKRRPPRSSNSRQRGGTSSHGTMNVLRDDVPMVTSPVSREQALLDDAAPVNDADAEQAALAARLGDQRRRRWRVMGSCLRRFCTGRAALRAAETRGSRSGPRDELLPAREQPAPSQRRNSRGGPSVTIRACDAGCWARRR